MQRLAEQRDLAAAAVVQPGKDRQQRRFTGPRLANQGDGLPCLTTSSTPVRMES
jgi:hypothetical protein